jgi:hypothetical protein
MRRSSVLVALFAVAVTAPRSAAQTIDFESIASPNYQTLSSYTEDGFTLTPGAGATGLFGSYGSTQNQTNYTGSTALFHQDDGATITLTQVGGGAFNLSSIDVSELFNSGTQTVPLNFTGNKAGGGTVSAHFDLDGTFGNQTLTFNDFTNLSSVTWTQESEFHQFDNIVVAPVPEPATVLGVAALGGGLLGLVRRYRRRYSSSPDTAGDFITSRNSTVA